MVAGAIDGIDLCACVYKKSIHLYYVGLLDSRSIKDILKTKLQPYMIPDKIVQLEEMPRTSNGKIDREALKKL